MFIKNDATDALYFEDYIDASSEIQSKLKVGQDKNYHTQDIALDLFSSFYKANPQKEKGKIPQGLSLMSQALNQISECQEFKTLRNSSKLDPLVSGIATESMLESLIKYLPKIGSCKPEDIRDSLENGYDLGMPESQIKILRDNLKNIEAIENKADQLKLSEDDIRGFVRQALSNAQIEVNSTLEGLYGLGQGIDPMSPKPSNIQEKMQAAKAFRDSPKLQAIMAIAGQMIRVASKVQQSKNSFLEYVDVEPGGNLNRLLASETMKLAKFLCQTCTGSGCEACDHTGKRASLKGLFYKGIADKALLQYKLDGKEPKGKGPIIVCIDSSGSMAGDREIASKGIALAMLNIARHEKRAFALIQFASRGQATIFRSDKNGQCNTMDILSELEMFLNGGTDFETPLDLALTETQASTYDHADILFITDGLCDINPSVLQSFLDDKEERSTSILGIAIGCGECGLGTLHSFCDQVFSLDDIVRECPTDKIFSI